MFESHFRFLCECKIKRPFLKQCPRHIFILINPFQKDLFFAWKEQRHPEKEIVKKQLLHNGFFLSSNLAEVLKHQKSTGSYTGLSSGGLFALSFPISNEVVGHIQHTQELIARVSTGKLLSNVAGPWHQFRHFCCHMLPVVQHPPCTVQWGSALKT